MARNSEARAALIRLAHALESNPNVKSVHGENRDGDWHAWVVVSHRSWKSEHAVIETHVVEDPDFCLTLHIADRVDKVPRDAERITGDVVAG